MRSWASEEVKLFDVVIGLICLSHSALTLDDAVPSRQRCVLSALFAFFLHSFYVFGSDFRARKLLSSTQITVHGARRGLHIKLDGWIYIMLFSCYDSCMHDVKQSLSGAFQSHAKRKRSFRSCSGKQNRNWYRFNKNCLLENWYACMNKSSDLLWKFKILELSLLTFHFSQLPSL